MGIAKNGLEDGGHDLADTSLELAHEVGSFQGHGQPDVLMVDELAELVERAVNRPEFSLGTS